MQATTIDGVWMWSSWQADRSLFFNSYFVRSDEGNIVVDPLELDDPALVTMGAMGGVAFVIVTNRDHLRASASFVRRFGAKLVCGVGDADALGMPVEVRLAGGDMLLDWRAIALEGCKSPGEIALYSKRRRAIVVGDVLWGTPAGALTLMPSEKLADAKAAARSLRQLRGVDFEALLVGDGAPIFSGARDVLTRCFDGMRDPELARINLADVPMRGDEGEPAAYVARDGEIGLLIGAERLGYRIAHLAQGKSFCPMHYHLAEEELFIVWNGTPTLVTPHGETKLRRGDFVAFPAREIGAHKVRNDAPEIAEIVMISNIDRNDVCFYPDSGKVFIDRADLMVRSGPELDYFEGES